MTPWHADEALLMAYSSGELDDARAFSVESHLLACPACQGICARTSTHPRLDAIWSEIVDHIDAPSPKPLERLLRVFGVREHIARLVSATPSLQLSWILAIIATTFFAVLAAHAGRAGEVSPLLFLLIAPLTPLAGITAAYGPGVDPTYEIGLAAPMRSFELLFLRAAAVLTTSMLIAGAGALALPVLDWRAAAWLIPALALTATGLAFSTVFNPLRASAAVATVWVIGVLAVEKASTADLAAFRGTAQSVFAVVTIASLVVIGIRRNRFEVANME